MSTYRVIFTWKGKELELKAKSLDLTHPYFVSIKDLIFPEGPRLIINPAEDELLKNFGKSKHIMIPFQTVHLIEELFDEEAQPAKVRSFKVIEGEKGKTTKRKASSSGSAKVSAPDGSVSIASQPGTIKPRTTNTSTKKSRAANKSVPEDPTET
ncbi:MAG: hypothetical protein Kow009_05900 [Spirochaetales bacterium]